MLPQAVAERRLSPWRAGPKPHGPFRAAAGTFCGGRKGARRVKELRTTNTFSPLSFSFYPVHGIDTDGEDGEVGGAKGDLWRDSGIGNKPSAVRLRLLKEDPGLNQSLISSGTTISQLFTQDKWEHHRMVNRYFKNLWCLPVSTVLRRILRPCLVPTMLCVVVGVINTFTPFALAVSHIPHTLAGGALGLLLVFRTNSSSARFLEGRRLWGAAVKHTRDLARLSLCHLPRPAALLCCSYAKAIVQVFAHVLKAHLRSGRTRADAADPTRYRDDPREVVMQLLPPAQADALLHAANRPLHVLAAVTQIIATESETGTIQDFALQGMERSLQGMGIVSGGCERIFSTPLPLSYTRHTSRSLMIYLTTLPLALWPLCGWGAAAAAFAIAFLTLGIDEIGVEIEEPFCILPIGPLCNVIDQDISSLEAQLGYKPRPGPSQ